MQLSITFRHFEASDALKEYAQEKVERVNRYLDRPGSSIGDRLHSSRSFPTCSLPVRINPMKIFSPAGPALSCSWKRHDPPSIECLQNLHTAAALPIANHSHS